MLEDFACAVNVRFHLQGRLYVTTQKLVFHSIFNARNFIIDDTLLTIPLREIYSGNNLMKKFFAFFILNS